MEEPSPDGDAWRGFARQRHRISVGNQDAAPSKERMAGFSKVMMARIAPGPALAAVAVAFALTLCRLQFGIGHTTFDYMSQARWLLEGGDLGGLTTTQPPAYTIVWLLLLNLPQPLLGGFILSLLCQGITVWCVYELIARPATPKAALVGATLVALNGALAGSADYVWVEAPFTAALTGAWLAFERLIHRAREQRYAGPVLGTALLVVLPLYLRYAAAPVLAVMLALALFTAFKRRRRDLALFIGLVVLFALPLPLFNWAVHGMASGHPIGIQPAQDLLSSFLILARELGSAFLYVVPPIHEAPLFNLTNADGTAMRLPIFAALLGIAVMVVPLAIGVLTGRGPLLRLGIVVLAYLLFYALVASHTRIDRLSLRFVVPIIPLAIAGWVMAAPVLPRAGALALAGAVAGFGVVGLMEGLTPDRYGYAPETLAYVAQKFPKGSVLLTNAYGRQIDALTPGFRQLPLPYDDPFNDGFSDAYGIAPWSESELEAALAREPVQALVILLGPGGDDPYLDLDSYGEAVKRLVDGARPGAQITRLSDGLVVTLEPQAAQR
jgi:hypothetical protein